MTPSHFRSPALALLTVCLVACTKSPAEDGTATRTVILDKETHTVLDQDVQYPTESDAQISVSTVLIPPGTETGSHRHDTPLVAYIVRGTLTVYYDGGVTKKYSAGDALVEAIGTYHNARNEGSETVEVLAVSIGAEGLENTVARP